MSNKSSLRGRIAGPVLVATFLGVAGLAVWKLGADVNCAVKSTEKACKITNASDWSLSRK